jgi:hypothetical protein
VEETEVMMERTSLKRKTKDERRNAAPTKTESIRNPPCKKGGFFCFI